MTGKLLYDTSTKYDWQITVWHDTKYDWQITVWHKFDGQPMHRNDT